MFHTRNRISWPSMTLTKTPFFWTWFQRWKSTQLQMSHVHLNLLGSVKGGAFWKVQDTSFTAQIWALHLQFTLVPISSENLVVLDFSTQQTSPVLFAPQSHVVQDTYASSIMNVGLLGIYLQDELHHDYEEDVWLNLQLRSTKSRCVKHPNLAVWWSFIQSSWNQCHQSAEETNPIITLFGL